MTDQAATVPQVLVITDWLPAQLANGQHGHWAARQKRLRNAQEMVYAFAKLRDLQPVRGRARLTVTFVFGSRRRRDTDNLYARAKGLIDGIKLGGWIVDDSTDWLDLEVRAEVVPGVRETRITLEESRTATSCPIERK